MGKTTGSDLLIRALRAEGVDTVFGIAGDHILHMLDTMFDAPLRMVDFRHESGAVHAADSYSRILKKGAVMLSTTPGHANALPALAVCAVSDEFVGDWMIWFAQGRGAQQGLLEIH